MTETDLYAVLGVPRSASTDAIKKAYRKLARQHHPDLNPGNRAAEERFKAISEAHDVLSDPEKRKLYDEFGRAGIQSGFDAQQARAYRERAADWQRGGGAGTGFGGYTSFEDLFGDIFTGHGAAAAQGGADAETELAISLLDAVRGLSTSLNIEREEPCATCAGSGDDPGSATPCADCQGTGRVQMGKGPMSFTRLCSRCAGRGRVAARPCQTCDGHGTRRISERLTVHIPPGVDTGSRVRVAGKGGAGRGGAPPGDLYIRIAVRPHALLERRGDDLHMDLPLTVAEAMLGATIDVPTPDGSVRVKVPAASQAGRQLRVKGHGVPTRRGGERGDLYLRLVVQVPDDVSGGAGEAARALDAAYRRGPRQDLRLEP